MSVEVVGAILLMVVAAATLGLPWLKSKREARPAKSKGPGTFAEIRESLVDQTTNLAKGRKSGNKLGRMLESSGSQMRVGEWLMILALIVVAVVGLITRLSGLGPAIVAGIMVPIVAVVLVQRKITQRQEDFADQLPDLLQNLSSALRSGQSLPQAIAAIAPDLASPSSDELKRVVIENRIGRDLIASFTDLAHRMDSPDFDWVVRAVDISYKTGGDLSIILRRLDATIRSRNQVAGAVRAMTAEGRISGVVLTMLPPFVLVAISLINDEFVDPLFATPVGNFLLVVCVLLLLTGSFWLSRLTKFNF